jgi:hypothetical protein
MGYNWGQSDIPLPILEFLNVSFIEKDSIEVKFGDLFGSETININFQSIDIIPVAKGMKGDKGDTGEPGTTIASEVTTYQTGKTVQDELDDLYITKLTEYSEIKIKVYTQDTEPILDNTNAIAIWINTCLGLNRIFLIFKRGTADQVSVELTA